MAEVERTVLVALVEAICEGFEDAKYGAVRHQALAAMLAVLRAVRRKAKMSGDEVLPAELVQRVKLKVEEMASTDTKPIVVQLAGKLRREIFL